MGNDGKYLSHDGKNYPTSKARGAADRAHAAANKQNGRNIHSRSNNWQGNKWHDSKWDTYRGKPWDDWRKKDATTVDDSAVSPQPDDGGTDSSRGPTTEPITRLACGRFTLPSVADGHLPALRHGLELF